MKNFNINKLKGKESSNVSGKYMLYRHYCESDEILS